MTSPISSSTALRLDSLGRETVYPFSLSCSTESPWNPREIVCEDNYMEVSVRKNVPVIAQEGLEKDWEAALSIVSAGFLLCCSAGPGSGDVCMAGGFPPDQDAPQNHDRRGRPYRRIPCQLHVQPRHLQVALRHAHVRGAPGVGDPCGSRQSHCSTSRGGCCY
ncbi:UNVERIFIED_CONTAM: hypothetical protein FKN15_005798 [Acipenser sinensis]